MTSYLHSSIFLQEEYSSHSFSFLSKEWSFHELTNGEVTNDELMLIFTEEVWYNIITFQFKSGHWYDF